jgi:hypothetical protein
VILARLFNCGTRISFSEDLTEWSVTDRMAIPEGHEVALLCLASRDMWLDASHCLLFEERSPSNNGLAHGLFEFASSFPKLSRMRMGLLNTR